MKRIIFLLFVVAILATGCGVSQSEFDALKKDHESLKADVEKLKSGSAIIDQLQSSLWRGKLKATMGDMKTIANAIGSYLVDNSVAPEALTDIGSFHIKNMPMNDAWGNSWMYFRNPKEGLHDQYVLVSAGEDGNFTFPQGILKNILFESKDPPKSFGDDIVLQDGSFTYTPR